MKTVNVISVWMFLCALTVNGAIVERIVVRQRWPWKSSIFIEYLLTDVAESTDVSLAVKSKGETLKIKEGCVTGPHKLIKTAGVYSLDVDVERIARDNPSADLKALEFSLSVENSSDASREVLYKIFDLEAGKVIDVTRGALLNGEYGAVETDYSRIGEGYASPLDDVVIWTGVTNYPGSKTSKLVMRKIPAGSFEYPKSGDWKSTEKYTISVSKPFYIGVFELTQKQYGYFSSGVSASYYDPDGLVCNAGDAKPVQNITTLHGIYGGTRSWDASTGTMKVLKELFSGEGTYCFDLPTQAMWYRAMRAESKTYYYDGIDSVPDDFDKSGRVAALGRFAGTGGIDTEDDGSAITNGVVEVGLYRPNAFGLYDMIGNVLECTRDYGKHYSQNATDPISTISAESKAFGLFGNSWDRDACLWPQKEISANVNGGTSKRPYIGVRLAFFEDIHPNKPIED